MAAKLSFIAYHTRNLIRFGAVGLVIYTILHILVVLGIRYYNAAFPDKPPPPQPAYGIMPRLDFPQPDPNLKFNYRLETVTGDFPVMGDRARVYINHQYKPNLLAFDAVVEIASNLGFTEEPTPISPSVYRWRSFLNIPAVLEMHLYMKTFDLIYDWQNNLNLIGDRGPATDLQMFTAARTVMRDARVWTNEWRTGQYAVIYYRLVNGQLVQVDRMTEADYIQVNLRRSKLNGLDFVSTDPLRPVVWALVAKKGRRVVELHNHHQPIDDKAFSEYPLEPLPTVWSEILANKVHIASIGENIPGQEVVIRHFDLAYFQSDRLQKFTQPVFVIRGDRGFVAYAPAVDRRLIQPTP